MIKVLVSFPLRGYEVQAVVAKDGNQWCCLAGCDLQEGIAGFGPTANEAIFDFKSNFMNEAPK